MIPCCSPAIPGDPGSYRCFMVADAQQCVSGPECSDPSTPCVPGAPGTVCADEGGCWSCADILAPGNVQVDCCFPGTAETGPVQQATRINQCLACGGFIVDADNPCQPVVPDPACELPRDDKIGVSRREFTTDLLGTGVMALDEQSTVTGDQQFISENLTRPEEQGRADLNPCFHVGGRLVALEDSDVYCEACSRPQRGDDDSLVASYGAAMTVADEPFDDGSQYWIVPIRLPQWTEAVYRSKAWRCGDIVR